MNARKISIPSSIPEDKKEDFIDLMQKCKEVKVFEFEGEYYLGEKRQLIKKYLRKSTKEEFKKGLKNWLDEYGFNL